MRGLRVLVVEDEALTAMVLGDYLTASGATVLGPVASVADALAFLGSGSAIDVAYLDLNLQGESCGPIADALIRLRIPFVIVSATIDTAPERLRRHRCISKPASLADISQALASEAAKG